MKKTIISILCALLALSLTACNSGTPPVTEGPTVPQNTSITEAAGNPEPQNGAVTGQYAIGDIILADGSAVKAASLTALDSSNAPVAIIAGFQDDGTALGVGVHRSGSPLQWAPEDSAGYATKFTDTVCTQDSDSSFSGDTDGSDNWDAVCALDASAAADAAEAYPAFDFVNTYGEANNLSGSCASGWYMPSIAELYVIYQNREAINASLEKIYGLDSSAAMDCLGTNWYWSSSQADSGDDYAWFVHYFNGYAGECPKNFTNLHVLAVRAF